MAKIVIQNGRVIDPLQQSDQQQNIYIADGKIAAIGAKPEGFVADHSIDATNLVVTPGLVDLSAHLREPGYEYKATIATETKAAAKAGITTLCCWPDTQPSVDTPAVVELIQQKAQSANWARVMCLGALTQGFAGEQLAELAALKAAGCVGVTNAYHPVLKTDILRHAFEYAATHDLTVFITSEDYWLARESCVHEGAIGSRLGLPGIPAVAETIAMVRNLQLIEHTGVNAHFCRLSTAGSVGLIKQAKQQGLPVTADVAAHQLFLTEMDIADFNSLCHVRPPLRSLRDRDALVAGVKDGTIDVICSDHQPHEQDAKLRPFAESEPGISALETLLPLALRLQDKTFSLAQVLVKLTSNPAKVIGSRAGTLEIGANADIAIFDADNYFTLSHEYLLSKGLNTPFLGWDFQGENKVTLLDGNIIYPK